MLTMNISRVFVGRWLQEFAMMQNLVIRAVGAMAMPGEGVEDVDSKINGLASALARVRLDSHECEDEGCSSDNKKSPLMAGFFQFE